MGPILAIETAWHHWNQHRRFMLTRTAMLIGTIVLAMLCLGGGLTFSKATPLFMVLYFGFIIAVNVLYNNSGRGDFRKWVSEEY